MLYTCESCNNTFEVKKFKGSQYSPMVCSAECLKKYLKKHKKYSNLDIMVEFIKNDGVEAFENINDGEYRSKIEKRVADFFVKNDIHYLFENVSLMYRKRMYLPDFFLPEYSIFVEIKDNVWEQSAYSKFKTFQKRVPLILITSQMLNVWEKHNV